MASLIGPVRFMRPERRRKLKTNPATPLNRGVADWQERQAQGRRDRPARVEAVPSPEFGPPTDPRRLPETLRANREQVFAWAYGGTADRHFRSFLSARRCPLDDWTVFLELVRAWAEALYLTAAAMPDARRRPCLPGCRGEAEGGGPCPNLRVWGSAYCPDCQSEQDERTTWAPRTEAEARAAGLSIRRG